MLDYIKKMNIKLPVRLQDSNKSTFGRIINIAGSSVFPGAAYLSSAAALKTGCGYLMLACVPEVIPIVASMIPEVTYLPLKSENGVISSDSDISNIINSFDVISVGCGITSNDSVKNFLFNLKLGEINDKKIIIDADAINILAEYQGGLSLKNAVITPHPKELSRLLKVDLTQILDNREKYARIASQTYDCITVLKGHNTIITDGEKLIINNTGNSALAKAGTGDVLTGIISSLCAQKMTLFDAAALGVYIHGLSGVLASDDLTQYCVMASDVIDYIPFAINKLMLEV